MRTTLRTGVLQGAAKIGIFALFPILSHDRAMSSDKPFRRINELVASLAGTGRELDGGGLRPASLETACDDARELYERLVVLRHKARELAAGHGSASTGFVQEESKSKADVLPVVAGATSVRLDTRPAPDAGPRQTSLIDAIEHTEKDLGEARPADKVPERGTATPTLAEKLGKAAVADLGKAISLSHKFWFVAELFNGDRIAYDKTIDRLNAMRDLAEARAYLQAEVFARVRKPADPDALATFNELVERRFA